MADGTVVLKFLLDDLTWINDVRFELFDVPVSWSLKYYNPDKDAMLDVVDAEGNPVSSILYSDNLSKIDGRRYLFTQRHFPKMRTNRVELHLDRLGMRDGRWYPVGVRNFEIRNKIFSREDLPPNSDDSIIVRSALGHSERLTVDNWDGNRAIDGSLNTMWQCEPQPRADAVVSMYLDVRSTNDLEAVQIDRVDMTPVHSGSKMNIYYSKDDSFVDFFTSDRAADWTIAGTVDPDFTATGVNFTADQRITVAPDVAGWNGNDPWHVLLAFDPDTTTNLCTLWELESSTGDTIYLTRQNNDFTIGQAGGTSFQRAFGLSSDKNIIVAGRDENGWILGVAPAQAALSPYTSPDTIADSVYTAFHVGNNVAMDQPATGTIANVIVRLGEALQQSINAFVANDTRVTQAEGTKDVTRGDYNAILLSDLQTDQIRVGGDDGLYKDKVWTPVVRDFEVANASYTFPPVVAKYLKLEFFDLTPHPYQLKFPYSKKIKLFPKYVRNWFDSNFAPELATVVRELGTYGASDPRWAKFESFYNDIARNGSNPALRKQLEQNPEMLVDPTRYSDDREELYNHHYKFFRPGQHQYEFREVEFDRSIAYFVAIAELEVGLVDYSQEYDAATITIAAPNDDYFASNTLLPHTDAFYSAAFGEGFTTVNLPSFSDTESIQVGYTGSTWTPLYSDAQMSLIESDDITPVNATVTEIQDQLYGEGAGRVLRFDRISAGNYGAETKVLFPDPGGAPPVGTVMSTMVRMYLPVTASGTYELQVIDDGVVVGRRILDVLPKRFLEESITHISNGTEQNFQFRLVQTDNGVTEPVAVDFFGGFQFPFVIEVSSDGGTDWVNAVTQLNNPDGWVNTGPGKNIKVRVTSTRADAYFNTLVLVPWYLASHVTRRSPSFNLGMWGVNETDDMRATKEKAIFKLWHKHYPRRYSLNQYGGVSTIGLGILPTVVSPDSPNAGYGSDNTFGEQEFGR